MGPPTHFLLPRPLTITLNRYVLQGGRLHAYYNTLLNNDYTLIHILFENYSTIDKYWNGGGA